MKVNGEVVKNLYSLYFLQQKILKKQMLVTDIVSSGLIKGMLMKQVGKGNQEDVETQLQKYKSMSAAEKKTYQEN